MLDQASSMYTKRPKTKRDTPPSASRKMYGLLIFGSQHLFFQIKYERSRWNKGVPCFEKCVPTP